MLDKNDVNNLMKQAQKIQKKMQLVQEEIMKAEVVGESGAGLVKITIDGDYNCYNVEIDSSLLKEEKNILEDLVAAAFNDASNRISKLQKEKISNLSNKIEICS